MAEAAYEAWQTNCAHGIHRSHCVTCLRQALWDVFRILGGDTDGDPTPAAVTGDLCAWVIDVAREHREDYDELLASAPRSTDV